MKAIPGAKAVRTIWRGFLAALIAMAVAAPAATIKAPAVDAETVAVELSPATAGSRATVELTVFDAEEYLAASGAEVIDFAGGVSETTLAGLKSRRSGESATVVAGVGGYAPVVLQGIGALRSTDLVYVTVTTNTTTEHLLEAVQGELPSIGNLTVVHLPQEKSYLASAQVRGSMPLAKVEIAMVGAAPEAFIKCAGPNWRRCFGRTGVVGFSGCLPRYRPKRWPLSS